MPRMMLLSAFSALVFGAASAMAGPDAMTPAEARHLISRTGFGASPAEINALTGKSYQEGVDTILATIRTDPHIPMPAWVDMWLYPEKFVWQLGQTKSDLFYTNRWLEIEELSAWWMAEMVSTPSPLTERLVLFWHDHFATSFEVSENTQWMAKQNRFFRDHAAGNFADLAHGILQDPAMLEYLSNTSNVADAPNENLGREFLELFTLGENRGYTQQDVREAARALTGHTIAEHGAPVYDFDLELHDQGQKTLFGQSGAFDAGDLAELSLGHPEFGPYIVEKLWLEFVSDQPDPAEVQRLATLWRDNDLELKPLLRALFLTDAFWDPSNRGRLVKSPVETLVGAVRSLGQPVEDARSLAWAAGDNGQALFMPPNVGGWPGGIAWINDASASGRATALTYMLGSDDGPVDAGTVPMAMMDGVFGEAATVHPDDLRIGQTFVTYVRNDGDELGASIVLYDVGFAGHDWRSLKFWLAHLENEDFTGLYINRTDCLPDCLRTLPGDSEDPELVKFETWDGFLDAHDAMDAADLALIQAINHHLPDLVRSTAGHRVWEPDPDIDDGPPKLDDLVAAAEILARKSNDMLGVPDTDLVLAFSDPNSMGLAGLDASGNIDDIDAYADAREEATRIPAIPPVTYPSARDWLNALPGTAAESKRAMQALLAVPRQTQGMRHEMVARDAEALLRSLILAPEYQVN